jgi:cytochrome c553
MMAKRAPLAGAAAALLSLVWAVASALPAIAHAGAAAPGPGAAAAGSSASGAAPGPQAASSPAAAPSLLPDPYIRGSVQAGATKAAVCFSCHGPDGNSQNPAWPRLAGQNAVYIAQQLHLFKAGIRQNPVMQPMAAGLSDQDIDNLAVFFAAQTPQGLEADPSYWKPGRALYLHGDAKRGIPGCVACHGPLGRGNPAAGYPALEAQQSVYVVSQLQQYANGTRYSGPNATSATPNSTIMFNIAKHLTPEEMRDVASYVQGLR